MALIVKNIKVDWTWGGDSYALKGYNVAITPNTETPNTKVTTISKVGVVNTYTFNNVTLDSTIQYTAWVQALYGDKDSDWVSAGNMTVTDDGTCTIATNTYVENIALIDGIASGGVFTGSFDINTNYIGGANDGEIRVNAGKFVHPNGTEYDIVAPKEITTFMEALSQSDWRYIAFVGSDWTRFTNNTSGVSNQFIAVKFVNGVWKYDNNNFLADFTPNANDCIVAKITGQTKIDTIQMYANKNVLAGTDANNARSVITNFNSRNDRISTTPANPTLATDGTAVDHVINGNGSADISFDWSFTGTGDAYNIDGFKVYVYCSTSSSAYTFGTNVAQEQVFIIPADKRAFILTGVVANNYYTFGIQAYRSVDPDINANRIIQSSVVKSTATGENPYQPSTSVAFTGNITGTINGTSATTVVTNANNGNNANNTVNLWKASGKTTIDGGQIETDTISADKINIVARELVHNWTRTGVYGNWTRTTGTATATLLASNSGLVDPELTMFNLKGSPVLKVNGSGDNYILSDYTEIDPTATYKACLSVYCTESVGTRYFGLNCYDANKVSIGVVPFSVSARTFGTATTNPYFWSASGSLGTAWRDMEAYIVGCNSLNTDIPQGKNVSSHFKLPSNAKYIRIRLLHYGNGTTVTNSYWWSPMVKAVDGGTVNASQINAGTLTLGGVSNTNGTFKLKDASANDIVTMDNTGIVVNNASYRLIENDGTQYTVDTKHNFIVDHSFEVVPVDTSTFDNTYKDYAFPSDQNWKKVGSPRFTNDYQGNSVRTGVIFGNWGAICEYNNYVKQTTYDLMSGNTYTVSGYASSQRFRNTVGGSVVARIDVEGFDTNGTKIFTPTGVTKTITTSHVSSSIDNTVRITMTFTVPANVTQVDISIRSGSVGQWVVWDGIQLVEGSYPAKFETDGQLWEYLNGNLIGTYTKTGMLSIEKSGTTSYFDMWINYSDNTMRFYTSCGALIFADKTFVCGGISVENDTNGYLELRSNSGGTSYLDFAKNSSEDYNVRLINDGTNLLSNIGNFRVSGTLTAGSKSAVTMTPTYGELISYCDESPNHIFIDRGYECTDENGLCTVLLDPMFLETVNTSTCDYWVQLTPFEEGDVRLRQLKERCFIVKGTPNTRFIWRVEAERLGYEKLRWNDAQIEI